MLLLYQFTQNTDEQFCELVQVRPPLGHHSKFKPSANWGSNNLNQSMMVLSLIFTFCTYKWQHNKVEGWEYKCMNYEWNESHQGKLMRDTSIWWKLCTKAKCRKQFVAIIVLDDLTHSPQRHGIVVQLVWAHVMKWCGLRWVTWIQNVYKEKKHQHQIAIMSAFSQVLFVVN